MIFSGKSGSNVLYRDGVKEKKAFYAHVALLLKGKTFFS